MVSVAGGGAIGASRTRGICDVMVKGAGDVAKGVP